MKMKRYFSGHTHATFKKQFRYLRLTRLLIAGCLLVFSGNLNAQGGAVSGGQHGHPEPDLAFEKNQGQLAPEFFYQAKDKQATYGFKEDGVRVLVQDTKSDQQFSYQFNFLTDNTSVKPLGVGRALDRGRGRVNYFQEGVGMISDVVFNREVRYHALWPEIEARFYASEAGLKYDFVVNEGGDPSLIKMNMEGIADLRITPEGELAYRTPFGELRKGKPYTYQMIEGQQVEISSNYTLRDGVIGFEIGAYNPEFALVIDPVALKYATILAEGASTYFVAQTQYKQDKLYLSGYVKGGSPFGFSVDSQLGNPGEITTNTAITRAYLTCMKADGSEVIWHTVFNLSNHSEGGAIVINDHGDIFYRMNSVDKISGLSTDVEGVLMDAYPANEQTFRLYYSYSYLLRLSPEGDRIKYFTYIQPNNTSQTSTWRFAQVVDNSYFESHNMVLETEDVIVFAKGFGRKIGPTPPDSSMMPLHGFNYYNEVDKTKSSNSNWCTGMWRINTTVSGRAGLEGAAYFEGYYSNTVYEDGVGNVYSNGWTAGKYSLDFMTTLLFKDPAKMESSNGWSHTIVKFTSDLTTPIFATAIHPELEKAASPGNYEYFDPTYGGEDIHVDEEGNIYASDQLVGYFDYPYTAYDMKNDLKWPTDQVKWISGPDEGAFKGGYFSVTYLMKLPVDDYTQIEWINLFDASWYYLGTNLEVDNKGNIHFIYDVDEDRSSQPSLTTPGGLVKYEKYPSYTVASTPQEVYWEYVRLNKNGDVEYATPLDPPVEALEQHRDATLSIDPETNTAYIFLWELAIPEGHNFAVTPTYRNQETGEQVSVMLDETVTSNGKTRLMVFHEPLPNINIIDTFPSGADVFCTGALIGTGESAAPLNGNAGEYVSGDGSDSTHSLPLIFYGGLPTEHPKPAYPSLNFQWQVSSDTGSTWSNIPEGTKQNLQLKPIDQPGVYQYRRLIYSSLDTVISNVSTLEVQAGNFTLTISGPEEVVYYCPSTSKELGISVSGTTDSISWAWYNGFTPLDTGIIFPSSGRGTVSSFVARVDTGITAADAGFFRLVVTDHSTGCRKEFFVTLVPLTEKIYPSDTANFCPGDSTLRLGPAVINPDLEYLIYDSAGFTSNLSNVDIFVSDTSTYYLQVRPLGDTSYCATGETAVYVKGALPHDTTLVPLADKSFCSTDAPAAIGLPIVPPTGYSIQWSPANFSNVPGSGLDNLTAINPVFGPVMLPPGTYPSGELVYTMRATRQADGCVFASSMVVRDTLNPTINFNDEDDYYQVGACFAGSLNYSNYKTVGTFYEWKVVSTTYPGGKEALFASPDFGINSYGDTVGQTRGISLFYPSGNYNIRFGLTSSFYPLGTCRCESYDEYEFQMLCGGGGFSCLQVEIEEDYAGDDGVCGESVTFVGQEHTWSDLKWSVLTIDGVQQLPGTAPRGLFRDSSGVHLPVGTQPGIHPTTVIAEIADTGWGYPNVGVVEYLFLGSYLDPVTQNVLQCRDTVKLYAPSGVPAFELAGDIDACLFEAPATPVSYTNTTPYTLNLSDYDIAPATGGRLLLSWRDESGQVTSIVNSSSVYPTFNPSVTTTYSLLVKDTLTGCGASDSFTLNVKKIKVDAGSDLAACPGNEVQLEGSGSEDLTYSWSPATGLYFPDAMTPNSLVPKPYLLFPNASSSLVLTGTDSISGCVAADTVMLSPENTPPAAISDTTIFSCAGKTVTLGPSSYSTAADFKYNWTVGPGADINMLSSAISLNPTLKLPPDFVDSLSFTLTISRGSCGSVMATYTLKEPNPGLNLAEDFQLSACGAPFASIGAGLPNLSDYLVKWGPVSGLYTDVAGTMAYTGTNTAIVYPNPTAPTTYTLVATHTETGCRYYDKINVNPPSGVGVDAGEDKLYCFGAGPVQIGSIAIGGAINWTAVGFNSDPSLGPNTTPDATMEAMMLSWLSSSTAPVVNFNQAVLTPGSYRYRVTVDPSGCNLMDEVEVTVYPLDPALGGENMLVCEGVNFQLGAPDIPVGYLFEWTVVSPDNGEVTIENPQTSRTEALVGQKTVFALNYVHVFTGCEFSDQVTVSIAPTPTIQVTQPDVFCEPVSNLDITTYITGYDSILKKEWYQNLYPSALIPAPTSINASQSRRYVMQSTNEFGCQDTATVVIQIQTPQQPILLSPVVMEAGAVSISLDSFTPPAPSIEGGSFSWHNADTALSSTLLASKDVGKGTYYLFETSPAGCISESGSMVVNALPPVLTARLDPDSFSVFVQGSLYITITNPDGSSAVSGMGYSGTLPSGLVIASGSPTNDCGGTLTANVGDSTVTMSGANVAADTFCTVVIPIKGSVAGVYALNNGQFSASGGGLRKSTFTDTTRIITSGDFDGDGIDDATENTNSTNPLDPCDPPQMVGYTGYVASNMVWSEADCDGDSLINGDEKLYFTDPFLDDLDGDGVKDGKEAADLTFSTDPCDPVQQPGYTGYVDTNLIWRSADCDGDSILNGVEDSLGIDPYNPDTDGDGVGDSTEVATLYDPLDPCDPAQDPGYTGYVDTSSIWKAADCDMDGLPYDDEVTAGTDPKNPDTDGDGVLDGSEVDSSYAPLDPCDPAQDAGYTGYVDTNSIWQAADCDMDMILNGVEDSLGSDPYDIDPDMELYGNGLLIEPGDSSLLDTNLTNFGSRFVNSVKRHRFLVKNVVPDANGPLTTGPMVTVTGGDGMFTIEFDQDCEILPTGEAYLIIKYQPTDEGCHTATISIPHNDADKPNPYSFKVQGKTKNETCE